MASVYTTHSSSGRRRRVSTLRLVAAAAVAAVLVGGYQEHWSWTGISGRTATLWDWISLLLLPVTVATLPIWLTKRHALDSRRKTAGWLLVTVFAAIVLAGYLVPWGWTGFEGNALWDWINLLLLPLVVATFPVWPEIRQELRMRPSPAARAGAGRLRRRGVRRLRVGLGLDGLPGQHALGLAAPAGAAAGVPDAAAAGGAGHHRGRADGGGEVARRR